MSEKPKTRRGKGETRPESDQKAQSKRFIETARKIEVDESGHEFERALKKSYRRR
jgi:hypothetical protein